jgi:putative protease
MQGVCSPGSHVRYRQEGDQMVSELGAFTINRFPPGEAVGYPNTAQGTVRRRRQGWLPL